jgi:hypothetical protein
MVTLQNHEEFLAWKKKNVRAGDVCIDPTEYPVFVYEHVPNPHDGTSRFSFLSVDKVLTI